ncbi:hypothetical protein OJAV_G00037170 [Oryzias javanicus]|uniref:RING-type E3 ubiquitin transferase n=1 Tax=Oryzias javanicus TaxID=123683 RepID=A0A3S2N5P7_ORYJA|nr:hypothetical protein OJAV_G00037170 [Oryzias javanicus]
MTTGRCFHLPGSLCDCANSTGLWKGVEDGCADGCQAHYVTQVTAIDGRLLSSVLKPVCVQSDGSICRICHEGGGSEDLLSPVLHRAPQRPLTEWLQEPGPRNEKRTLFWDMVCFLFITPLAAISGWLCLRGAQDHLQLGKWLQATGLIALTIALFTIYILWTLVSFRYHCQLYSEWRKTNQRVCLLIPEAKEANFSQHSLLSNELLKKSSNENIV